MRQNRALPFGYHIQNGALCVFEEEAAVVRQCYADYLGGLSYRKIAEKLTEAAIPYLENRSDWNKHRVKRLLENSRYCGDSDSPAIVPAATFAAVAACIGQRGKGESLPAALDGIRRRAVCGACGARYTRDNRRPKYEAWCCTAEGRITPRRISDSQLLASMTAALNALIEEPGLLDIPAAQPLETTLEITRLSNQINRELEKSVVDGEATKQLIFRCAAARYETYRGCEAEYATQRLRALFAQAAPLEEFSQPLFESAVKQVIFEPDGSLILRLINEKTFHHMAEQE